MPELDLMKLFRGEIEVDCFYAPPFELRFGETAPEEAIEFLKSIWPQILDGYSPELSLNMRGLPYVAGFYLIESAPVYFNIYFWFGESGNRWHNLLRTVSVDLISCRAMGERESAVFQNMLEEFNDFTKIIPGRHTYTKSDIDYLKAILEAEKELDFPDAYWFEKEIFADERWPITPIYTWDHPGITRRYMSIPNFEESYTVIRLDFIDQLYLESFPEKFF